MVTLPGIPELTWLNGVVGHASVDGTSLTMTAPPKSDLFTNPLDSSVNASTPALCFVPTGDFILSARVSVEFGATFDAGVLLVHQGPEDYAKFCFEATPRMEPMIVSVVTRGHSDDSNGPVIGATTVWMRVSRVGPTFALHHSLDGAVWHLTRWFRLRSADAPFVAGFVAQSPMGRGCQVTFADVSYREVVIPAYDTAVMAAMRDGS